MKKISTIILSIGVVLLLTGCMPAKYTHPNKSEAEFRRDKSECYRNAVQLAHDFGSPGNPFIIIRETRKCLEDEKGWQRQ